MSNVKRSVSDYAEQSVISEVAISPSGDRVAYSVEEFDLESDRRRESVFIVPTDGSKEPHRISRSGDSHSPQWSPDGSRLGVISTRETDVELTVGVHDEAETLEAYHNNSNPHGEDVNVGVCHGDLVPQVWIYDLSLGGDARQITDRESGVSEFDWGPSGDRLVVAAEDPTNEEQKYREQLENEGPIETRRLQHKYDGDGWLDTVTTYLFVIDVDSGDEVRLDEAYGNGASESETGLCPAWSGDGDRIAFLSNRTDRPDNTQAMDVYTIRPDGTSVEKHTDSTLRCSGLRWCPKNNRIAFYGRSSGDMYEPTQLYVTDPSVTGEDSYWCVSESLDRPVGRGGPIVWTDEKTLLTAVGDEGLTRLVRFSANTDDPKRVFDRQGQHRTLSMIDGTSDTQVLVLSDPAIGEDLYVLSTDDLDVGSGENDPLIRLTKSDSSLLDRYNAPQCERITFENDGMEIEAIVYLPADFDAATDDPLPAITSIHGGPVSYDAPEHKFSYLHWTNCGYAIIRPNYRGSSSYGKRFSEAISGEWGAREPFDVIASVDEVVDRGWADPERLFVTGFSYGGVTTAFVLTESQRFRAAAAEHGIYDRYSYFGTGDSHNRMQADFGLPWEDEETYRSISSITEVGDIDTPLLITAGEDDWRCPPTQSEQLYVSVNKQGVPTKLVVYPNENHSVTLPKRAIHRLETIDEWFNEFDN